MIIGQDWERVVQFGWTMVGVVLLVGASCAVSWLHLAAWAG
ncbi:MAG TPA: hypothetical protein VHI52_18850 [Verrucomicrobiae bacterium]|nr:hypothetical protein [Verrucomicrobiae bacterium]